MAIAALTGLISGASSASLIALISHSASLGVGAGKYLVWGFVGLALVALITSIISQVLLIRLAQTAVFDLRMRLSQQILAAELSHVEALGSGRIIATLTEDVQAIANAVHRLPYLCIDLAMVLGCFLYITWLSWRVLLMVVALMVVSILSCQWLLNQGRKYLALAREDQDLLFKYLRTITDGFKELKLHYQRRQMFVRNHLQATANAYKHHNIRGLTFFTSTTSWGRLIFFFAIGFVLFVLPDFLTITPQTRSGYILTFTYLMLPMNNIVDNLPVIIRTNIALDKINSLGLSLANQQEFSYPLSHNLISTPPPHWQSLQLQNLTYTYQQENSNEVFTLGPINLTLHPGELVFIIGGNGSGKSTLGKLIAGLYIPSNGEICLDGQTITDHSRETYRQLFSAVFADFYLFDELLGLEFDINQTQTNQLDQQAQKYLTQLQLDQKVHIHQGKLSTTQLSQGQRKRLTLLTAYLENRPIYLFDEWAADQDPSFKRIFYEYILPELRDRGKTILVITHDDAYFPTADRILKLNYGQLENTG